MSRFFSKKFRDLEAYVPGEQPRGQKLIKLNTNENPFPPSPKVWRAVEEAVKGLNFYNDPECRELRETLAEKFEISPEELLMTNGSDEILNFAFMTFCDGDHPALFPDLTYGFYTVFSRVDQVPFREIPLREDMTINLEDYRGLRGTIFLANPNAPTGLVLGLEKIRKLLESRPEDILVVDEAYIDFGGETCLPLIHEYDNLLVVRTFSKSRSLAGLRLGFGAANTELIKDLKNIQYSTNPYNVDSLAQAAGCACIRDDEYNMANVETIKSTRAWTAEKLRELGFEMTDSQTNFLFVRHDDLPGDTLYRGLRERGILIRRFDVPRIQNWNRISVGSREDMEELVRATGEILRAAGR